jgi:plastocyanin
MKSAFVILLAVIALVVNGGALSFNSYWHTSAQIGSMATLRNVGATYSVSIIPGAGQRNSLYHYYPSAIAIPVGTIIAWFNNDFGQPHTVTSGIPNASDSGRVFNSGIMPASTNSFFKYVFNKRGDFVYHCEIHPWLVAIVSVSDASERGKNFELRSGVGSLFNLTKDSRALLDFKPITIPLDRTSPIVYNVTILKENRENVFSRTFTTSGESLPLELIAGSNETMVYGPDFSSTGAYHLQGAFLKGNAEYKILVNIASINSKPPSNPISDEFTIKTVDTA